jgi:hypothetical protein
MEEVTKDIPVREDNIKVNLKWVRYDDGHLIQLAQDKVQ